MEDYYELVGLERTASRDEIDRKLREQLRLWQRRTTNADLDRRQEAERLVDQLARARATLLDEEKRRRYDRQLTPYKVSDPPPERSTVAAAGPTTGLPAGPVTGPTTGPSTGSAAGDPWLSQARRLLSANDHQAAAYAAREALRATPNPPVETWIILARANTELGRLEDALFEAHRAVTAAADDPEAQLALAQVHERRQEWAEALRAYEAASRLDPESEQAHLGVARCMARSGRPGSALTQLERRYLQSRNRPTAGRQLAQGLVEAAEAVLQRPRARPLTMAEQGTVRRMLQRVREVSRNPETMRVVNRLEQQLARTESGSTAAGPRATGPTSGSSRYNLLRQDHQPASSRINVLAVASLVLALVGLVTCITAPVGAVIGHVARTQIRDRGELGEGMALAGIIVGWLATVLFCCGGFILYNST